METVEQISIPFASNLSARNKILPVLNFLKSVTLSAKKSNQAKKFECNIIHIFLLDLSFHLDSCVNIIKVLS